MNNQSASFWQILPRPLSLLAPMEEVTDKVFRGLIREASGPQIYMSEFTACKGILASQTESLRRVSIGPQERDEIILAQIWGNDPQEYYDTVPLVMDLGFKGLDINMGCPEKKITKKGCCSALITDPSLAKEIIQATKEGVKAALASRKIKNENRIQNFPVSVKTRIGFTEPVTEQWSSFLLEQGIEALTVHGRTSAQQSEGFADWNEIAKVVNIRNEMGIDTVIIGNGDIVNHHQIREYSKKYGVDGLMIGRGVFNNPLIFSSFLPNSEPQYFSDLPREKQIGWALEHLNRYEEEYKETRNFEIMKKFFKIYIMHFPGADDLRAELMETHDYPEAKTILLNALNE